MFANGVERADESALVALQHGYEAAKRIRKRADERGEKFDFRRKLGEHVDLFCIDDLAVDVGRLDPDLFNGIAESFERLGRRDRIGSGKNDARRSGEKRLDLRRKIAAAMRKSVFLTTE